MKRTPRYLSRDAARGEFIRAVRRCVPNVIRDLGDEPFTAFQEWARRSGFPEGDDFPADGGYRAARDPVVRAAIERWRTRWNLDAQWCVVTALDLLATWRSVPEAVGTLLIGPPERCSRKVIPFNSVFALDPPPATGEPVTVTLLPSVTWAVLSWHLGMETRSAARARLIAWATERIDRYLDQVQEEEIRNQPGRYREARELAHFEWLARYQVGGESAASIARTPGVARGRQTIMSAITALAARLDLTLRRPAAGGRPRKPAGQSPMA